MTTEYVPVTSIEEHGIRINPVMIHRINSLMLLRGIKGRMPAEGNSDWQVLRSEQPIKGSNGQAYYLRVINTPLNIQLDSYVLTI